MSEFSKVLSKVAELKVTEEFKNIRTENVGEKELDAKAQKHCNRPHAKTDAERIPAVCRGSPDEVFSLSRNTTFIEELQFLCIYVGGFE
jgi:hypothetical protein